MSAARFIGRVGALAVALGIGSAVASGSGVAAAAPESAGGTASGHTERTTASTDPRPSPTAPHRMRATGRPTTAESKRRPAVLVAHGNPPAMSATPRSSSVPARTPVGAAQTSLIESLFGWVRRTFVNSTPTLAPQKVSVQLPPGGSTTPIEFAGTDADGDALTYTVANDGVGSSGGTLSVSGATYTYITDPNWNGTTGFTDTFTVTVSDAANGFHVHGLPGLLNLLTFGALGSAGDTSTNTVTVNVTNDAAIISQSIAIPRTSPEAAIGAQIGPDGTVYQTSSTGTGRNSDPYRTTVTIIRADGDIATTTIAGSPSDPYLGVQIGPDGAVYETTRTGTGTDFDPYRTAVTIIRTSGTTTIAAPGQPFAVVQFGADGDVYQTSRTGTDDDTYQTIVTVIHPDGTTNNITSPGYPGGFSSVGADGTFAQASVTVLGTDLRYPMETTVTVIHPDGTTTTATIPGQSHPPAQISADGTVYLSTNTGDGSASDPLRVNVAVIRPDGTTTTVTIPGNVYLGAHPGPMGTAVQTTYTGIGTPGPYQTIVALIHPDGTTTTATGPGEPAFDVRIGPDGTVAQTSHVPFFSLDLPEATTVTVIHPDGTTTTTTISGRPAGSVQIGPDGTAYQTSRTYNYVDGYQTTITVIRPDGTTATTSIPGWNADAGVQIGPDGTAYQTTAGSYSYADDFQTMVTAIHPDGTAVNATVFGRPMDPYSMVQIGPDGSVYQTTVAGSGTTDDPFLTVVTLIHSDGSTTQTTTSPGQPADRLHIGADGTAYQTSIAGSGTPSDPYLSVVTVIRPDGTSAAATSPGNPSGSVQIGPDGTAYQTSTTATGTIVTVIRPDGATTNLTIEGIPVGTVLIGPDGTAYQTTSTRTGPAGDPHPYRTVVTVISLV